MNRRTFSLLLVTFIIQSMTCVSKVYAQAEFSDGDFANWQATNVVVTGPASSSASNPRTGGNPGAYWSVQQSTPNSAIAVFSSPASGFLYNPATQGSITDLAFSIDTKNLTSLQAVGLALEQNGKVYGDYNAGSGDNWSTYTTTYQLSELGLVTPGTVNGIPVILIDTTQHPDFSSSGSQISFGLLTANSASDPSTVGYDNFQLTVNSVGVPEASSLLITGIGLLGGNLLLRFGRSRR